MTYWRRYCLDLMNALECTLRMYVMRLRIYLPVSGVHGAVCMVSMSVMDCCNDRFILRKLLYVVGYCWGASMILVNVNLNNLIIITVMQVSEIKQLTRLLDEFQLENTPKLIKQLIIIGIHALRNKNIEISNEAIQLVACMHL